jgi:hypothetical protein
MKSVMGAVLAAFCGVSLGGPAGAEGDTGSLAIFDKAVKAMGGEEKLAKVKAVSWKAKGTIRFGDNESKFTSTTTVQDLDHFRREFEGDFGGNMFKAVTVVSGGKGWRKFGDNAMDLDEGALANEKRTMYLQIVPATLLPLRGKGFKVATAGEEKVDGKAALAVKATGPDGKDFTVYFDKKTSLPVRVVAKVVGFMKDEYVQETNLGNYKDFGGIQRATKIENKRDGDAFMTQEITDFQILSKVDPKLFAQPE